MDEERCQNREKTPFLLFRFKQWQWDALIRNQFRKQRKDVTGQGLYSGSQRCWRRSHQGAQEVEQRRIRIGKVRREAISLHQLKSLLYSIGFCFSDQARFPNPCFTTNQDNMSLSTFCLLNEHV